MRNRFDFRLTIQQNLSASLFCVPPVTPLIYRDHHFDSEERARKKGKQKEASMDQRRNVVTKGELGVRWVKARQNDSQLLATSLIVAQTRPQKSAPFELLWSLSVNK